MKGRIQRMEMQSRLLRELNRRNTRIVALVFSMLLLLFFLFWIPSVLRLSSETIDNRLDLIYDDFTSLVSDLQQVIYTFTHDIDIATVCIPEYVRDSSPSASAKIALHAQDMKSSAKNILNFCVDNLNGNLISSLNYSDVDRQGILDGLEGYQRFKEKSGIYLSPLMRGDFRAQDGSDQPYCIYAQSVRIGETSCVIVIFYDATFFHETPGNADGRTRGRLCRV